jgi:hypothetical protein
VRPLQGRMRKQIVEIRLRNWLLKTLSKKEHRNFHACPSLQALSRLTRSAMQLLPFLVVVSFRETGQVTRREQLTVSLSHTYSSSSQNHRDGQAGSGEYYSRPFNLDSSVTFVHEPPTHHLCVPPDVK